MESGEKDPLEASHQEGASDWDEVRLHVVTGKGGTGKTTVAAALAVALAGHGKTVLLCEVEERQGIARLFDVPELPYTERRIATAGSASSRGEVHGLAIDPQAALLEYLEMYYHLGRAGRALEKVGAVDFVTTIAPGLRDVLLTGKAYEAARRKDKLAEGREPRPRKPVYDAVVLDAPPTGRIVRFLGVNEGVADIARVGPIRRQADSIMTLLRSPKTAVHLVTLLEEMPVQETSDGIAELREAGIPIGGVVVNFTQPAPIDATALAAAESGGDLRDRLTAALRGAHLPTDEATVSGLLDEARENATRSRLEAEQRELIAKLDRPTYELPRLTDGVDLGAVYDLAAALTSQGMA